MNLEGLWFITPFPHVNIFIPSGDICDQSVKLPEIAPNFGRFLPSQILREAVPQKKCTHVIMPASRHVAWKSLVRLIPLAPKL